MLSLKNELPLWRDISKRLDQLYTSTKTNESGEFCPLCGGTNIRAEIMETTHGSDRGLTIGFFTCLSCNATWSGPVG